MRRSRLTTALAAGFRVAALAATLVALSAAPALAHHEQPAEQAAPAATDRTHLPLQLAALSGTQAALPRVLAQLDLEDHQGYNSGYIFGMTKGVARSTIHGAVKPMLMVLTVPLDLAFLPFAAIGGLFG